MAKIVVDTDTKVVIDNSLAEQICEFCEDNAIYDKLDKYGDFYYKIKQQLLKQK